MVDSSSSSLSQKALEVYLHNPWLTYTMGLHRLRESGLAPAIMDDLDERPLTLDEVHSLCCDLFVGDDSRVVLPHPRDDRRGFFGALAKVVNSEESQWNPVRAKWTVWISLKKLESIFDDDDEDARFLLYPSSTRVEQRRGSLGSRRHKYTATQNPATTAVGRDLMSVVQRWSHEPPNFVDMYPLERLLVTAPKTFPASNPSVEDHPYFSKWRTIDPHAFAYDQERGDEERVELLKRGASLPSCAAFAFVFFPLVSPRFFGSIMLT